VLAVPAIGAEARSVGAHAVLGAAWVAVLHVAARATPPSLAHAPAGLAHTVHTAVQAAHLCNTAGRNRLEEKCVNNDDMRKTLFPILI
jgi:hypothetical protein